MKKILLQIDSCLNMLSTGRITESIGKLAIEKGWDCYIVHGARYTRPGSCMHSIQAVSKTGEYAHFAESLLFDNHGLASRRATKAVIEKIKQVQPDLIQLHCVHGYYMNYKLLFKYLNTTNIPVVWTFHDCWAFTGHCAHFVTAGCEKWKTGCFDCPLKGDYPKSFIDRSRRNYELKKSLFAINDNLHIVSVSEWLADLTRESFLKDKDIHVIHNGVDLNVFYPKEVEKSNRVRVLGVSGVWNKDKGLYDFYKLRELIDNDQFEIVLIGLTKEQLKDVPGGIIGIERTNSVSELAEYYSSADVFVNPTYADSFPTVNMEALACGTPVITYRTGGSPEAVSPETGWVVEQGDIQAVASIVSQIVKIRECEIIAQRNKCRERAELVFNKDVSFDAYLDLYNRLVSQR